MLVDFDIVIVGGGLVGYAFALDIALQKPKFTIAILESKPYIKADLAKLDNKIYAISPNNIEYLKNIGGWYDESRVGVIKTMDVSGDSNSNIILAKSQTKHLYLAKTIEYNNLHNQLYAKLKDLENVTFIYDKLSEIKHEEKLARLIGQNKSYTTHLIIGADGANSFVRKEAKIEVEQVNYLEHAVVANFKCELPHDNIAYQWFLPNGILAYLPLPHNYISIVWSSTDYNRIIALDDNQLAEEVAKNSNYKLGKLELVTKAVAFPLRMYMPKQMYANKVALIGDAAFIARPHVGGGITKAAIDARTLSDALGQRPDDIDAALRVFEQQALYFGKGVVERARGLGAYLEGQLTPLELRTPAQRSRDVRQVMQEQGAALTNALLDSTEPAH